MREWVSWRQRLALLAAQGNLLFLWKWNGCLRGPFSCLFLHFNFNYIIKAMPSHLRTAEGRNSDRQCGSLWLGLVNTPNIALSAIVEVFGEIRGDSSSSLLGPFAVPLKVAVLRVSFPDHSQRKSTFLQSFCPKTWTTIPETNSAMRVKSARK